MAVPPVEVKAMWDASDLKAGAAETVTALGSVTTAADAMGTAVPESADKAAVGLTTKATKFKAVGTELGQTLTDSVASGVEAPQAAANVGTALSGLLAASATTGVGIAAAVGVGLAVAIVKGLVDGAAERKKEVIDAYNSLFNSIEVEARQSSKEIKKSILDAFDFSTIVTEFGGGDINAGIERINELVVTTGQSFNDITLFLQRGVTPATQETADALKEVYETSRATVPLYGGQQEILTGLARTAKDALDTAKTNNDEQAKLLEQKKREVDFANSTELSAKQQAKYLGEMVGTSARVADNTARAADAAFRLGQNLGTAARQASNIALNGVPK